jgi:hypothetical protein
MKNPDSLQYPSHEGKFPTISLTQQRMVNFHQSLLRSFRRKPAKISLTQNRKDRIQQSPLPSIRKKIKNSLPNPVNDGN